MTSKLLIVGGGLFGSQAATYARARGIEATVFDAGLPGAASPAAAGLFKEAWAGRRFHEPFRQALPVLDQLYGIRKVQLRHDDDTAEEFLFVPPGTILAANPVRRRVTAIGDGWLEVDGQRHEGWVYVAAGVWCGAFSAGLQITGKAGASYVFPGERRGRIRSIARGRQALAFVRDAETTFFSDGTAEVDYADAHDQQTLAHAESLGLTGVPVQRLWGRRPYTRGGPLFRRLGERTWLATGGRKMGTIFGAAFARRLIDDEIRP
ncbi:MAG: NAD(P)/FAD-dependent oxidoreductase [Planctomycetes bacterium]|nr:NAD(P)/FAD-dependent oxidoreductase [Planctomycetota bacterium]